MLLNGATTLSIATFSIMTHSIMGLFATLSITALWQHNSIMLSVAMLSVMLNLLLCWVPLCWMSWRLNSVSNICEQPRDHIHSTSVSLQPTTGLNKLKCYITLGWIGLLWTNTLAYWVWIRHHSPSSPSNIRLGCKCLLAVGDSIQTLYCLCNFHMGPAN